MTMGTYLDAARDNARGVVRNSAGGESYETTLWNRVARFLILGTDSPTYYASAPSLTADAVKWLQQALTHDAQQLIAVIVDVSTAGRAPRNDAAIFALAYCLVHLPASPARASAEAAVPRVVRTGTHLFQFVAALQACAGGRWNRARRRAVTRWYLDQTADALAYQAVKYRNREGWTHRDVLRLAHAPRTRRLRDEASGVIGRNDDAWEAVMSFAASNGGEDGSLEDPRILDLWRAAQQIDGETAGADAVAVAAGRVCALLQEGADNGIQLPWEALPASVLGHASVWCALVRYGLPLGALLRNLGRMTANGALNDAETRRAVVARLQDATALRSARIHPLAVLVALNTYNRGSGVLGKLLWRPQREIVDALDAAFYASFGSVMATGARILLALDVSGSMAMSEVAGMTGVTPRVGSAAMALITMAAEARAGGMVDVVGFTGGGSRQGVTPLSISPRQRLDDVVRMIDGLPFGPTDCAAPVLWAHALERQYDAFVIYTDNEHWAGSVTPARALREYRAATGIDAVMIAVAMTATRYTVADPADPRMMDVVGFDTAAPEIMARFITGRGW